MIAASGRQQKASIHASYTLSEYLCRPVRNAWSVISTVLGLPNRTVARILTLKLEGEVICQMPTFVIAPEEEEGIWVPDLEGPDIQNALQEQSQTISTQGHAAFICYRRRSHLDGKVPSVNVVSQEKVPRICWVATDFKELHEVELHVHK